MKYFILPAILLFSTFCFAQDDADDDASNNVDNKRFAIGFNDGYSVPIGNFAKSNQSELPLSSITKQDTNHLAGYAQHGFHYDLYASYRITPHIGVMAALTGSNANYDANTLNSQYIQYFAPNTITINAINSYQIQQYLIGPAIYLPLQYGFSIEVKALVGYTTSNYPDLIYLGLSQLEIITFPQGSGFGYSVGAGIKYITGDGHIGVHVNIAYAGSAVNFRNYTVSTYTLPSGDFISSTTYNAPKILDVSLLQLTAGISFEL